MAQKVCDVVGVILEARIKIDNRGIEGYDQHKDLDRKPANDEQHEHSH